MHILLLILKIIGIVLLILLGVLLLLLFCVLFVPIRYRIEGCYRENTPKVRARIKYLFPLIYFGIGYEQKLYGKLRLLGIPVFDLFSKKEKNPKKKKRQKKSKNKKPDEMQEDISAKTPEEGTKQEMSPQNMQDAMFGHGDLPDFEADEAAAEGADEAKKEPKLSLSEKIEKLLQKLQALWDKLSENFSHLDEKKEDIEKKIDELSEKRQEGQKKLKDILEFLKREDTQKAFQTAKKTLLKLLKSLRPRKMRIHAHIGMDDPAVTGEICMIYGMLYPFVRKCVMIEPDFEKNALEGDFLLKGYITGFLFLRVAWTALFSKDLKCIRKMIRKQKQGG